MRHSGRFLLASVALWLSVSHNLRQVRLITAPVSAWDHKTPAQPGSQSANGLTPMTANNALRLTSTASRVFAGWYFINGVPASLEDAEVLATRGLPHGDYWVARDFVRKLRTLTEIKSGATSPYISPAHRRSSYAGTRRAP